MSILYQRKMTLREIVERFVPSEKAAPVESAPGILYRVITPLDERPDDGPT